MKSSAKIILVTTALALVSGTALAARGFGCPQGGGYYSPGPMQGQPCMLGRGGKAGMQRGRGMGLIYQLDGSTDEQKLQIAEVRKQQHERRFQQRELMFQQRAETRAKIDAILTDAQRQQWKDMRPNRW